MTIASQNASARPCLSAWPSGRKFLLALAVAAAALLLLAPMTVPIGPMYWDVFIYFGRGHPQSSMDRSRPSTSSRRVGPPDTIFSSGGHRTSFLEAQPLLLSQWSLPSSSPLPRRLWRWCLPMSASPLACGIAFALLVPFVISRCLPFNNREFYPYPGSDGFGSNTARSRKGCTCWSPSFCS